MGEVESMASMGTVGSYQPSLASLATDATGTSVASVVLPCAHPQYHGRHARPLGPLAVDDTTPHLRQASLTLRQQKQLATSTLAVSAQAVHDHGPLRVLSLSHTTRSLALLSVHLPILGYYSWYEEVLCSRPPPPCPPCVPL